jgi:hypothetical protein
MFAVAFFVVEFVEYDGWKFFRPNVDEKLSGQTYISLYVGEEFHNDITLAMRIYGEFEASSERYFSESRLLLLVRIKPFLDEN